MLNDEKCHCMDKCDICIIRAKLKNDYVYDAIKHYGYQIFTPYRGNNLLLRVCREVWFRGKLPCKSIWFRYVQPQNQYKIIILFDPLIMPEYIEWIHKKSPSSRVILSYENRADKTIHPDSVPSYVEKWSYDKDDCNEYNMRWKKPSFFLEYKRKPKVNPKYDILYVGRDKGRADRLFEIEKALNKMGLKTLFHICADRKYLRFKKPFYKRVLNYEEYLALLVDSKAVLNIVPDGQQSVTQREMEAAFDGMKCITNNKGILDFELYEKSRYFVLGVDDFSKIKDFLNTEIEDLPMETIKKYDFDNYMKEVLEI